MRWGWTRSLLAIGGVVAVLGVGVLVATRGNAGGESDRSVGQTVSGFFQAQQEGDCRRLIELVTRESWSDGGRLSRAEFLEQCADAVEGYDPDVEQVRLELESSDPREDPDRAVVGSVWPAETSNGRDPERSGRAELGRLVREDGEWKVEIGLEVLRIGRSAEQTVIGYVEAYNDGDCGRLVDHLSEGAWSRDGEVSREEFLDGCDATTEARGERPWQAEVRVRSVDVEVEDGDDRAVAAVTLEGGVLPTEDPERVVLVREGMGWKLHGRQAGRSDDTDVDVGTVLPSVELNDLAALLLSEIVGPEGACFSHADDLVRLDELDGLGPGDDALVPLGVRREFGDIGSACEGLPQVALYRFDDADQATAARDDVVEALTADRPAGGDPGEPGPLTPVHLPPVPEAVGYGAGCDTDACDDVVAMAVHDRTLVHVTFPHDGDLTTTGVILQAQLARLERLRPL